MTYQETTIQITFRHPAHLAEVLSDDVDGTEAVLEAGISPQLLELYGANYHRKGNGCDISQSVQLRRRCPLPRRLALILFTL